MLGAFVVAFGMTQPAVLAKIEITPAMLAGTWEVTSAAFEPRGKIIYVFDTNGTYCTFQIYRDLTTNAYISGKYKAENSTVNLIRRPATNSTLCFTEFVNVALVRFSSDRGRSWVIIRKLR